MKRVDYAGGSFVTTDAAAAALIAYATALGTHSRTDSIAVPCILPSGRTGFTTVLIGPSSEMMTVPIEIPEAELDDADVLALLASSLHDLAEPPPVEPSEQRSVDFPELDSDL